MPLKKRLIKLADKAKIVSDKILPKPSHYTTQIQKELEGESYTGGLIGKLAGGAIGAFAAPAVATIPVVGPFLAKTSIGVGSSIGHYAGSYGSKIADKIYTGFERKSEKIGEGLVDKLYEFLFGKGKPIELPPPPPKIKSSKRMIIKEVPITKNPSIFKKENFYEVETHAPGASKHKHIKKNSLSK